MKNIEINEKQKENLLKMCKVLFPEYVIYPADNDGFIEGEQWVGDQNMGEDRPVNEFNIHWFEFCMTHLIEKLLFINSNNDIFVENSFNKLSLFKGIIFDEDENQNKHPVDYLYEEFKKLK